jgi:hypothetical protein
LKVFQLVNNEVLYLHFYCFMQKPISICFLLVLLASSCGPDLSPEKYDVKSILLSSYEEYAFQYQAGRLQKIVGTDSIVLNYTYFKDSTSILHVDKSGKLFQRTQLAYLGSELSKVKVKWKFGKAWYSDSVMFSYSGSSLATIAYKKLTYQTTMQNGNLTGIRVGTGSLSVSYSMLYDQKTNPLESVYWLTPFILPSGTTAIIQPNTIARYFSKNNLSNSTSFILGATETNRYSYTYLHDILPKSINLEVETSKSKVSDLVFVFDIQYQPKELSSSSP